jgi:branched-chain amino acid transport system permease protein
VPDTSTILQFLVNGVGTGCIYGLVAIGFAVIFNASGIVNFAQGAFVMLGGIITYVFFKTGYLPLWACALLSVVITAAIGAIFQILIVRPLFKRRTPIFMMILATLAVAVILENVVLHLVGDQSFSFPPFSPGPPFKWAGVVIDRQMIWIVSSSIVLVGGLVALYRFTIVGKAMKACAINPQVASILSIPVQRMLIYSFALSAALGAVAGILITPTQYTAYHIAVPFSVNGFVAALIGGLGNPAGAFVGGIVVGLLQSYSVLFFSAGYKEVVTFSLLLVFLFIRPGGLFGSLVED